MKSATDVFAQKNFLKEIFNSKNLLGIRLISNWTSCRTIQGVIVLVISNQPRASRSFDFEITRAITPRIVLHSVQLLSQIKIFIIFSEEATSPSPGFHVSPLSRSK